MLIYYQDVGKEAKNVNKPVLCISLAIYLIAVVLYVIKRKLCEILYLHLKPLEVLIAVRIPLCCVLYQHVMP